MIIAVYPGTFDPVTNGHIDIAARAARIFHRVAIGVYEWPEKEVLFNVEERLALAREAVKDYTNISVEPYSGLTVDFARKMKAQVMVRGLRVNGDFESEFDMAMMNNRLDPDLDIVCFMASPQFHFLSRSIIKEVAKLQGNINDLVPQHVIDALHQKWSI